MIGQRLPDATEWSPALPAGAYWRDRRGEWVALTPNNLLAGLSNHTVIEADDGTITVSPSILVRQPSVGEWHGHLERGVWSEC